MSEQYDALCDAFRIVNLVLTLIILVLLQRANHIGEKWVRETTSIHKFLTMVMVLIFLGGIEKIYIDAKPAWIVFAQTFVFGYGIAATVVIDHKRNKREGKKYGYKHLQWRSKQ